MKVSGYLQVLLPAAGVWLLAGCGPTAIRDAATSTYVPVENGEVTLHRPLTVAPGRTRVYLQGGEVSGAINEFEPHCQFRVREIAEHSQRIEPDRFAVGRVFGTEDQVVMRDTIRLASAAATTLVDGGGGDGSGESRIMYIYFMTLNSPRQPQVTYLACGGAMLEPSLAEYPTLQEIRSALGEYATLTRPAD